MYMYAKCLRFLLLIWIIERVAACSAIHIATTGILHNNPAFIYRNGVYPTIITRGPSEEPYGRNFLLFDAAEEDLPPGTKHIIFRDVEAPRPYLWKTRWPETDKKIQLRAKKHGVGQIWSPDGVVETVTALHVLPCTICEFMEFGYAMVSYGKPLWERHWNPRPKMGKLLKICANNADLFPVKLQPPHDFVLGQILDASAFVGCTHVRVTGITKGKGFAGVIKRHGFKRGPMSHGSMHHRGPGSIGPSTTPGSVRPGKRMPGRAGCKKRTFRKIKVLGLNPELSMLYIKGLVAGPKGSYVTVGTDMQPPVKELLR
ncbi:50S ribosomal protein L3, putative [Theileria equi strain WA]|uniref:Large ribosomal subunit protein uL3c n=1 Tax=Theileria equi strain WA TaxID=1537102 RepID=L1LAZ7_THEEQ|nr:50S ribosomal protein L3, putative [Theileria equi strain WA]EKX72627.1 50S ribosomal protein L3, putative [Theileria equi strain WA]|eukprot:XP_004832079.1 50S ribosomal protein L3, putative [Theileria equi strain WA]